ncbi:uncharacterized protein LOC141907686 [Tubulanus polymorphus]|uniref:uncharacterized protein LOC141907686 n=1 Tax=Tubulanus polymorphus TaxID=672921 RepID=UPI003DA3B9B9
MESATCFTCKDREMSSNEGQATVTRTTTSTVGPPYPNRWVLITGIGEMVCALILLVLGIVIASVRSGMKVQIGQFQLNSAKAGDLQVHWWAFIFFLAGGVVAMISWKVPKWIVRIFATIVSCIICVLALIAFICACVNTESYRKYMNQMKLINSSEPTTLYALSICVTIVTLAGGVFFGIQAFFCVKWAIATHQQTSTSTHTVRT